MLFSRSGRLAKTSFSITIRAILHLLPPDPRESEKPGLVALPLVSTLVRQLRPAPKCRNISPVEVDII